jgi:hypothetical protein
MTIDKIITSIIKHFPESIKTKLKNINKAGVEGPCTTKRVSQESRMSIPYSMICSFKLSQLQTYKNGIVIRLPFNDYERIRKQTEERSELDDYLIHNIGGNDIVSCFIILVKEDGNSGSSEQREQYEKLDEEIKKMDWKPIQRVEIKDKNIHKGNEKWYGHYYFDISGGQQDSFQSHKDKKDQIFTTYKGFMSNSKVINDVKASLIYQMLHCHDISICIKPDELTKYKNELKEYLKNTFYLNKSCYELIYQLGSIKQGKLISPIRCEPLSISMFENEKEVDISHNEAVCKKKIYFCENNNILLSDYRPGNLFWDLHLGNMQQQDFTIDEYWADHDKRTVLHNSLS